MQFSCDDTHDLCASGSNGSPGFLKVFSKS